MTYGERVCRRLVAITIVVVCRPSYEEAQGVEGIICGSIGMQAVCQGLFQIVLSAHISALPLARPAFMAHPGCPGMAESGKEPPSTSPASRGRLAIRAMYIFSTIAYIFAINTRSAEPWAWVAANGSRLRGAR